MKWFFIAFWQSFFKLRSNGIEKPHNFWTKDFNFVQFFFFFSNLKAVEKYLEAFNFSVFVDCYKKENSEKVIKEAVSCQYVKKKYFSHITDKCSLRRNSLKALVIMSSFLSLFLLLFSLIVFISLAFSLYFFQSERFYIYITIA